MHEQLYPLRRLHPRGRHRLPCLWLRPGKGKSGAETERLLRRRGDGRRTDSVPEPLLLHKDNAFVRFHANQGLVLFLAELVVEICLGGVLWLAGAAFCLYCLVLGAKAAAAGKCVKLPLLGDIQLIK